jgi:hypothetical protein
MDCCIKEMGISHPRGLNLHDVLLVDLSISLLMFVQIRLLEHATAFET